MKNKKITSYLLAFVMVFNLMLGNVLPAFAVIVEDVTISFDVDGKCETPDPLTVEKGTALQDKLPHPEYTDENGDTFYAFSWLKEKGNLDTEIKEYQAVAEETITLYANWLQKFEMTFDYGGYAENLVIGMLENTEGAYPGATTVGDYTIEGWYFDAEYTQPCPTEGMHKFTDDVTFYAKIVPPVAEGPQIVAEGNCGVNNGDNLTWKLYDDGHLVISGTGDMYDEYMYHWDTMVTDAPWGDYVEDIVKVTVEDGVNSIGWCAFHGLYNLKEISVADSVTAIDRWAFRDCSALESFTFPKNMTTPEAEWFCDCTSLKSVTLPDNMTELRYAVFYNCPSLESIVIPEGVTEIGWRAFCSCTGLKEITLPASLKTIDDGAFEKCTALTDIYYGGSQSMWNEITVIDSDEEAENNALSTATVHFAISEATVTLYIPEGDPSKQEFKVAEGTSLYDLMKNINDPTAEYDTLHFAGWRTQGENGRIISEEDMKNIIVNDDMGLIAQWKGDTLKITYVTGTDKVIEPMEIEAGKTMKEAGLTLPNFERPGYRLRAWLITSVRTMSVERQRVYEDITLTADWEDLRTTSSDLPSEPTPAPHVHSWNPARQSDATTHYYVCTGCGAKDEVTTHTFNIAGNCTVCGYHSDAAVITPQPTPEVTPEPSVEPSPEVTPAPAVDTTIVEEKASEDVVEAAKDVVVVEENKATVDKEAVEAIVNATEEGKAVVLPLAQTTEETVTEAVVNTDALKTVADNETDVVIELTDVTVKLDAAALSAVTEQAEGENIEIKVVKAETETLTPAQQSALENKETAVVVTAQIFSNGEYIGDFKGGKATVMLPFTPEEGKSAEDYKVYFIGEDGVLEEVEAKYVDGHMVFTTAHFSDYVIVYETSLTDAPVQPQEPVKEEKASMPILPIIIAVVVLAAGALLLKKKKA